MELNVDDDVYADNHNPYPLTMKSSSSSNSFLADAFPRSVGRNMSQYHGSDIVVEQPGFLYSVEPSKRRDNYGDAGYNRDNSQGMKNLNEMLYQVDREYQTMEAVDRGNMGHLHYQYVEEDENTQPGCMRRTLSDVLDVLLPKYRAHVSGRGTYRSPAKARYPILSPRDGNRFKSSAINFSPERQGSFESTGSFERAKQFIREVSHRTSDGVHELQQQLKAMVQDRALRQAEEDEKLLESHRLMQMQIEQHQAAMANHMTAMQAQQQQYCMSPMYASMLQNGMVNGMMNHQQLNDIFTQASPPQDTMGVAMPKPMQQVEMKTMQSIIPQQQFYKQQQEQREPTECTPRSNDRFHPTDQQRSGMSSCSPPRAVKVVNGTKMVFSQPHQQSDASTLQSIQETVERAMKKSDAARMQRSTSKKLWNQASKIKV